MKLKVQVIAVDGDEEHVHEVLEIERSELSFETLGLSLAEGKAILGGVQAVLVKEQLDEHLERARCCLTCDVPRRLKGHHSVLLHSAFGDLRLKSPRLWRCACEETSGTFSPLAALLPGNTTPELLFLQAKWASLVSYGATVGLLSDALPMSETLNAEMVRRHALKVAKRAEDALDEEKVFFADVCQRDIDALPAPDGPLIVGLDGGFVHARGRGWFEVIAGKSIVAFRRDEDVDQPSSKCFAFVTTHDQKPRRRLFEHLRSQGMQPNQAVTFMSDGGDNVRKLPLYLHPSSEHVLDWFHVAMRFTVLGQFVKGLPADLKFLKDAAERLERAKHHLWHGHAREGDEWLRHLADDVETELFECEGDATALRKFSQAISEMVGYVGNNSAAMVNYGERYRAGERISTGFVESAVNQVVSKRFAKKQSMSWSPRGAHLLLQLRTRVLNNDLKRCSASGTQAFERLRSPRFVVGSSMYSKIASLAWSRVWYTWSSTNSRFRVSRKLYETALSQHSPFRLMRQTHPWRVSAVWNRLLLY